MTQSQNIAGADLLSCAQMAQEVLGRFGGVVQALDADEPQAVFPTVSWQDVSALQSVALELGDVLMSLVIHLPDSPWAAELRQAAVATDTVVRHLDEATFAMPGYQARPGQRDQPVALRPQSQRERPGWPTHHQATRTNGGTAR